MAASLVLFPIQALGLSAGTSLLPSRTSPPGEVRTLIFLNFQRPSAPHQPQMCLQWGM